MRLIITLTMLSISVGAKELKSFKTDYCTMFMDGNWGHCCLAHDLKYWIGGTKKEQLESDMDLKSCVESAAGEVIANLMYHAVRAGHHSPVKSPYKWSWGWGEDSQFDELTREEKKKAAQEIRRSELDPETVEAFILKYKLESNI